MPAQRRAQPWSLYGLNTASGLRRLLPCSVPKNKAATTVSPGQTPKKRVPTMRTRAIGLRPRLASTPALASTVVVSILVGCDGAASYQCRC